MPEDRVCAADRAAQPFLRPGDMGDVFLLAEQFLEPALGDLDEEIALILEIAVDRAFDDPGALGDIADHAILVAAFREQRARSRDDFGDAPLGREAIGRTAAPWRSEEHRYELPSLMRHPL